MVFVTDYFFKFLNSSTFCFSDQEESTTFGTAPGLEWRYSFSQAEIVLSTAIPPAAKTAYLALKATVKRHMNKNASLISSYALKCILYRNVERHLSNFWEESQSQSQTIAETSFW